MRNRILALAAAGLAAAGLALAQQTFITIGSGATTGVYFPVATGIAKMLNDANVGIRANARSTGGSAANINAIASGELQMALAQNDVAFYAYNGTGIAAFQGKPVKSFRAMAALYPEVVHIVARADARIRSIEDLKGKRVITGDVGSGTVLNAQQILEAYGMTFADLGQNVQASPAQGIGLLQDGRADAMFYTVGLGASAIQQIAQTVRINIVPVDLSKVKPIAKKYPFYVGFNIPSGVYKGVDVTTPTVALQSILIAAESLPADTVYNTMKAMFASEDAFKKLHPNLANYFSLAKATRGLPVPLHPGAERFYREKGLLK